MTRLPIRTRRANDEGLDDDLTEKIVAFLGNRLSKEDMTRLENILRDHKAKKTAEDEPPPFEGEPKPGGAMAADSRGKNYEDRFPGAARIGII
jgi:hypothetical protein